MVSSHSLSSLPGTLCDRMSRQQKGSIIPPSPCMAMICLRACFCLFHSPLHVVGSAIYMYLFSGYLQVDSESSGLAVIERCCGLCEPPDCHNSKQQMFNSPTLHSHYNQGHINLIVTPDIRIHSLIPRLPIFTSAPARKEGEPGIRNHVTNVGKMALRL